MLFLLFTIAKQHQLIIIQIYSHLDLFILFFWHCLRFMFTSWPPSPLFGCQSTALSQLIVQRMDSWHWICFFHVIFDHLSYHAFCIFIIPIRSPQIWSTFVMWNPNMSSPWKLGFGKWLHYFQSWKNVHAMYNSHSHMIQ